jgi:hypothetical protein
MTIANIYPAGAEAADVTTCDTTYVVDDGRRDGDGEQVDGAHYPVQS